MFVAETPSELEDAIQQLRSREREIRLSRLALERVRGRMIVEQTALF